ncbi:hypothetical protein GIB67_027915 [Kingdonia uniflora]|uniref:Initiator tRNA phosphoribosyl transferase family protein n=1 Tax=Kingdonia uniflora TaxID=39325 RepID=A0A7J7LGH2_9MAGN|nr:hypothetical protein GIB67_027915 [Kingdonia uniflora]
MAEERMSIYKASRTIKKKENSLYNALRSIHEDSIFVSEISQLWPNLPLIANLRCGLWYSNNFDSSCYFKSTDGHCNNWSFNTSRLNLHVASLAGQKGGCIIVDSTRRGKRFPDSMSKTIPIWACVMNRAIANYLRNDSNSSPNWDCSLHLPLWVSETEKASIEDCLEKWTRELEASGVDISSIASSLKKPLRPLWITQKTIIWINEVPEANSWDFTPVILVNASSSSGVFQQKTSSKFSWNYIPGAGDDEESWARGLSPNLFWRNAYDLMNSGPGLCNQKIADIVEKDRVYHTQRGQCAPQISIKPQKSMSNGLSLVVDHLLDSETLKIEKIHISSSDENCPISWLASTNLAVGTTRLAADHANNIDCILNCDNELISAGFPKSDAYIHLPIVTSKFDRFSLITHLGSALDFAKSNLRKGKTILICCSTGEDISVCVSLAILTTLFNDEGLYDDGKSFGETCITKWEMRKRLVFICTFATNARPSRGNLKQVFSFLNRDTVDLRSD